MLPLDKADAVIVAIGQDFAASVQTVALLKQLGVKRIIARGFDKLHIGVLQTLGVQTVTFPESLAAEELAESLTLSDLTSSYKIDVTHYIFEVDVPKVFVGHALQDLKLADYNLIVITIKTPKSHTVLLQSGTIMEVLDKFDTTTILKEGEILVLYGQVNDFNSFSKNYSS